MLVSDHKTRTVSARVLFVFAGMQVVLSGCLYGWAVSFARIICNTILLAIIGVWLGLYAILRKKKMADMIGIGDAIFFAAISPMFDVYGYVLFLIISSIVALLYWPIARIFQPESVGVPMISVASVCFMSVILYRILRIGYGI